MVCGCRGLPDVGVVQAMNICRHHLRKPLNPEIRDISLLDSSAPRGSPDLRALSYKWTVELQFRGTSEGIAVGNIGNQTRSTAARGG